MILIKDATDKGQFYTFITFLHDLHQDAAFNNFSRDIDQDAADKGK